MMVKIKDLAEGCVTEAEKPYSNWPDTCKEFMKEFIKGQSDLKTRDDGKVWRDNWDDFVTPGKLDGAIRSKLIRKALKELFPDVKFSVRLDRYSMGNSIDIRWKDGPASRTMEQTGIKWTFGSVSHDEQTGEILSGGNSFVFNEREYSDDARKWANDYIKQKFDVDDATLKYDNIYNEEIWRLLARADFRTDPPTIRKNLDETI